MRPLTNSNFVCDFFRFKESVYFNTMVAYLQKKGLPVPDYQEQYSNVMRYFEQSFLLHKYGKFQVSGKMSSTPNTKSLQAVTGTDDARYKLCLFNYYKYRAHNIMFGFNTNIMRKLSAFSEFNSLRKNQLLAFYKDLRPVVQERSNLTTKYKDYYFMPQFEVGQQQLVDLHYYTYELDMRSILKKTSSQELHTRVCKVNDILLDKLFWSTQKQSNYDKHMQLEKFRATKEYYNFFLENFMSVDFFQKFAGLGFADINPKEKDVNSLTQTTFYLVSLMRSQAWRMEYEFEKECINQMAKSTLSRYLGTFSDEVNLKQKYKISCSIGYGYTYTKYNTLMHFLNVMQCYWENPDVNSIQVFGKDIRTLLAVSCQKIFFHQGHDFYHYGPIQIPSMYRDDMDLQVSNWSEVVSPFVARDKVRDTNKVVITDRVYEYNYLKGILIKMFKACGGKKIKTDDVIINLTLLSLLLDFGLYEQFFGCLNVPILSSLKHGADTRELQVEISNSINEFDKANKDSVQRIQVEELIFEASYKFIVNKGFSVRSAAFQLINQLNSDPFYHKYLLLCKLYISLCQINQSSEVDYYKIRCNNDFRILIPKNFSKATSDYLSQITKRYNFSEQDGFIVHDEIHLFDIRESQPEINLFKIRFDSDTKVESMVKYIEISNVFRSSPQVAGQQQDKQQFLIFIADSTLLVEVDNSTLASSSNSSSSSSSSSSRAGATAVTAGPGVSIRINKIPVEIATIFFNRAVSFVPCFKYSDSEDVILFTSPHIHYLVDKGGQFNENYYGMKFELMECILSEETFVDLNDHHGFKQFNLSELVKESKIVLYFPDYLLQVSSRQQLINLLDYAIYIRNISFFILVLYYLRRASIDLDYIEKEKGTTKITGPWKRAILYVLGGGNVGNEHYDSIFEQQFFNLNQYADAPLAEFVDVLCKNFTRYQRHIDGAYQIVPTEKQKAFLQKIVKAEECFHFSEVGSGKTKVILPLLCQLFLSNNVEAHAAFARGGKKKHVLVILVPEHLVNDARTQVFRYCLNINFREEYRIYDDIFALLNPKINISQRINKRFYGADASQQPQMKQIFVTSFNQFKKALTYDEICQKIQPYRQRVLVLVDEVDDFLERDKLVFNICSNKNNDFQKPELELYREVCSCVYNQRSTRPEVKEAKNPSYWEQLCDKLSFIHAEIQHKSRSINKSFGIFNEQTLRHSVNIAQDIEGYKALIARPYESVNRAMPGSYYSDVERTIYLTYYILMEDISKYDDLFQQERKFISFEYYTEHLRQLDFDELVYGNTKLSSLVVQHPYTKPGLTRFLFQIILRKMDIQDKSRSVNSIDVVFNFDCLGFTGTPFLDNYPTFAYIRSKRQDKIPDLIDRSFYMYSNTKLSQQEFEDKFSQFQGKNSNVIMEYVPSTFVQTAASELDILEQVFAREQTSFNVLVDLCGVFKKTTIYEVRDLVLRLFGRNKFKYIYHIDQADGGDRVLYLNSDNDVQYDEEFYKYLCKSYGPKLRENVFFFVDNRNVIGKDIPFQLVFQKQYGLPLFYRSVVLAHDVDDFSKIWQAMGRSRTMSETRFAVYKHDILDSMEEEKEKDIKMHALTRQLYVTNCDRKIAGNMSSIYQTLISLFNLANDSFYHTNEIVNVFLLKMQSTINRKVEAHLQNLSRQIMSSPVPLSILIHILQDKLRTSSVLSSQQVNASVVQELLSHLVQQKFEQRQPTGDIYDDYVRFLSGEQASLMEVSYTKQQQKQKMKQQNKNQDSDTMEVFDKAHQLPLNANVDDYFKDTLNPSEDYVKAVLNVPIAVPILKIAYALAGEVHFINVYPTLQFLYSNHIKARYITPAVKQLVNDYETKNFVTDFLAATEKIAEKDAQIEVSAEQNSDLSVQVLVNLIGHNCQYSMAGIRKGVYVVGMKDQLNIHDLANSPFKEHVEYVSDEVGFILYNKRPREERANVDKFGPYFIEQYLLMEVLTKQEVAQNVIDYYLEQKPKLQAFVERYSQTQGMGFICWRFIVNQKERERASTLVSPRKFSVSPAARNGEEESKF